jgi:thiosulfate reductase cytochrome b subunit
MSDRTAPPPGAELSPDVIDSAQNLTSSAEIDSNIVQRPEVPLPPPVAVDEEDDALQDRPYDRRKTLRWPNTERREKARSPKAHLFVTLCHWSMVFLMTCSLLSGMRIGWGYIDSPLVGPHGWLSSMANAIAPIGTLLGIDLITFHVWSVFFMFAVTGVYLVYLFRSRASKRLQLTLKDLKNLTPRGIRVNGFFRYKQALWSANLLTYWLSFATFGVLLATGFALYRPDWELASLFGGHQTARYIHGLFAYLLIPYVVLHAVLQWCFGRFWTIFKAQIYRPHVMAGVVGVLVCVPVAVGLYYWDAFSVDTLTVKRIPVGTSAPVLDGKGTDAAWATAKSVVIHTTKGVNNPGDDVDVTVRAVHDGEHIYFQFQWADPDVSYKRYPLMKTAGGWKVLQNAFEWADENEYYEDKLAMYITDVKNGTCATTCHLGVGPDARKGLKHGVHYTAGEVGDVWHWKSVRTNPMGDLLGEPGWADDQHFRGPDPEPLPGQGKGRYTAGYYPDPSTGGGYKYNFEKLDPSKPLKETYVRPVMLPPTDTTRPNIDPTTSDYGSQWWIQKAKGIKYSPELDTYPVGTLLPNIIIEPFQGDEADIRAKGDWQRGVWTLEMKRVLDTKSKFDVPFNFDRPVYISLGTFNRSQTRHSEHIRPVKVVLEQ